jgi:hypothetical protein
MSSTELTAKPDLIEFMFACGCFWERRKNKYSDPSIPALMWNEYTLTTDGEKWYFHRPFYRASGEYGGSMTAYPCRIPLVLVTKPQEDSWGDESYIKSQNLRNQNKDYTYEQLTELITSKIEIIPNKNE